MLRVGVSWPCFDLKCDLLISNTPFSWSDRRRRSLLTTRVEYAKRALMTSENCAQVFCCPAGEQLRSSSESIGVVMGFDG